MLPPQLLEILGAMGVQPQSMGTPMSPNPAAPSFAPTPDQADEQRRQQLLQILGSAPQSEPPREPGPLANGLQNVLAGLAGALSVRHGGGPSTVDAFGMLRDLRRERMAERERNTQRSDQAKKTAAGYELEQMDKAKSDKQRKQDILDERKFQGDIHTQDLKDQRAFQEQERIAREQFDAKQTAERLANEEKDRALRKTIADADNENRMAIARIEHAGANSPDKVMVRQEAQRRIEALSEAKKGALEFKAAIEAGQIDPLKARQQFQDKVEVDLDGKDLAAAMAWFDLKNGTLMPAPATSAVQEQPAGDPRNYFSAGAGAPQPYSAAKR